MKAGFIGAGKVGKSFGVYLTKKGLSVSGYYSRSPGSAREGADLTGSTFFESLESVLKSSDVIFITTPDSSIEKVCSDLCRCKLIRENQLIGHMSGAFGSGILEEARRQGARIFSSHPLLSFAGVDRSVAALETAYFALEGDFDADDSTVPGKSGLDEIKHLFKRLGNPLLFLKEEQKVFYHICACIVSNFLYTLMDEGLSLFEKIGIPGPTAFKAVMPLIKSSLSNIETMGPALGLTGPLARGDVNTIKRHLDSLSGPGFEEQQEFYTFMAGKTLDLARKKLLKNEEKAADLEKLLDRK